MRLSVPWLLAGALLLGLSWVASKTGKTGRLGERYSPNMHVEKIQGWQAPTGVLESVGCCIDEIKGAYWNGTKLDLDTGTPAGQKDRGMYIPGGVDILSAVPRAHRVWLGETRHQRLLRIDKAGEQTVEVGSNAVGGVYGLQIESDVCSNSDETCRQQRQACYPGMTKVDKPIFLMTTGPRIETVQYVIQEVPIAGSAAPGKMYLSRSGPSASSLLEYEEGGSPSRLDAGEELVQPSGLALSPDGKDLFVADERSNELVWLQLVKSDDQGPCGHWSPRGKFARFPLQPEQKGLFRGLITIWNPEHKSDWFLVGAAPGGLYFYYRDGRRLGVLRTDAELSYVIGGKTQASAPADGKSENLLYVVAGKSLWKLTLQEASSNPFQISLE
jgi:hypothetical protein